MAEQRLSTTFWQHFRMVCRRTLKDFQWTRDTLVGAAVALSSILLQAHWGLITVQDWQEHWGRWVLSAAIPYCLIVIPHLIWRFAQAPWRVHQELEAGLWSQIDSINKQLIDSTNQSAVLQERLSKQTFPDNRPKITIDRWGRVQPGNVIRPERGFYLTNHGDTALEVQLEEFTLADRKWVSPSIASIGANQISFLVVEQENCPLSEGQGRWYLHGAFIVAKRTQLPIRIKYRDFNRNWYRSLAMVKYIPIVEEIEVGPTEQEKLGSS